MSNWNSRSEQSRLDLTRFNSALLHINHYRFYRTFQTGETYIAPMNYVQHATKAFEEFIRKIRVSRAAEAKLSKHREQYPLTLPTNEGSKPEPKVSIKVAMRQPRRTLMNL